METCLYCHAPTSKSEPYCCKSCELLADWTGNGMSPLKEPKDLSPQWIKFNHRDLEAEFNSSKCPLYKDFNLYIEGLQCSSCVHLLEDLPLYCRGVLNSRINFSDRTLYVKIHHTIGLGYVCEVIESLGYTPTPLNKISDYEKAKKNEQRNSLKRIGVAGAVAGNTMLFSIGLYAGLYGTLAIIFKWIMFFIFLPILFYSAIPFYKKSWASLLVRRINIDMMITAALWAGFLFSSYSLLRGENDLYFDSTSSFIFLILITRYFVSSYQDRLIRKDIFESLFISELYELNSNQNKHERVSYKNLLPGSELNLNKGQLLPCDAILKNQTSAFDLSYLTGEAYPQTKHCGDRVQAGSRLVDESSQLVCTSTSESSELAVSLKLIASSNTDKNEIQLLSDLVAHRLTVIVFGVAALFFAVTYSDLGFESFKRCLALITIACPCAVAFGTPMAFSFGLKKAAERGFFIRSETVFERLSGLKKIIFDKTGTLTSSELKLIKTFPKEINEENKAIMLGLEKSSLHPMALGLKRAWSESSAIQIEDISEIAGDGVSARYNNHSYRLSKCTADSSDDSLMQANFSVDGSRAAYLYFAESVRPEAEHVVRDLLEIDCEVMILSGDKRVRAVEVSKKIGVRPNSVFAEQSPESKIKVISEQNPCLYAGDGLNDIGALSKAHVSFAIRGTFESTLQVSDIYAPQKDLNAIPEIIHLSKKVQNTVKTNLLFAIFYNTVGGLLALGGFINPLVAAVLMPISSFIITAHTVWRLK